MGFQLSPGVKTAEIDLSTVVTGVATTGAVIAGPFQWGPAYERTLVDSELTLVERFNKPDNDTAETFFSAASFLAYGNNLNVVRCLSSAARNASVKGDALGTITITLPGAGYVHTPTLAITGGGGSGATATCTVTGGQVTAVAVSAGGSGYSVAPSVVFSGGAGSGATAHAVLTADAVTSIVVDTPGSGYTTAPTATLTGGNGTGATAGLATIVGGGIISVTITAAGTGFTSAPAVAVTPTGGDTPSQAAILTAYGPSVQIKNVAHYDASFAAGQAAVGEWAAKWAGDLGNGLKVSMADSASFSAWDYKSLFDSAPGTSDYAASFGGSDDELHVAVIDTTGRWTGTAGDVLERFAFVSKASDAKTGQGESNYYAEVINRKSAFVWWMDHTSTGTNWGNQAAGVTFATLGTPNEHTLLGGVDGNDTLTDGNLETGYDLFNVEEFDFNLIVTAGHSSTVVKYCIDNIAESRQDCVVLLSPPKAAVVNNPGSEHTAILTYRNVTLNANSSYAFMDNNWIKKYDKYNDTYRWIPANGDVAGLMVRTDETRDPWFSPAGLNRGQIKGVRQLAWNAKEAYRDVLYQAGVNPIVSFPGQGAVLFGDKTLQAKASAFDRINVRRLFIVLRKAISRAAKYILFEFNDEVTRAQFRSLVDPFLRDIQGRRGIYAYKVVCDASNNSTQTIDTNGFNGDIYVQPARSINFIKLNFIATRTGVSFEEIVGKF